MSLNIEKMSKKSLVSVIMPFHNTRPSFMREAIDSVIQQSYPSWELMLIDDGSEAPSSQIALNYESRYPGKIRYLEHPDHENRGASASRQLGIQASQGDFVAFLDSDDIWLPHKLEEQIALLERQVEADALYGNTLYWYSWTGLADDIDRDWMPSLGIPTNTLFQPPTLLPMFLSGKAAVPGTCSLVVRREVLDRIGGFEEAFKVVYTDQVFYAKLTLNASIFVVDRCWDRYRQHENSSCAVVEGDGQMQAARRAYLAWLEEYLREKKFQDREVWRALRMEQWRLQHPKLAHQIRRLSKLVNFFGEGP